MCMYVHLELALKRRVKLVHTICLLVCFVLQLEVFHYMSRPFVLRYVTFHYMSRYVTNIIGLAAECGEAFWSVVYDFAHDLNGFSHAFSHIYSHVISPCDFSRSHMFSCMPLYT